MAEQGERFERLLADLADRGLTQAEVGQRIGLPPQVVSDIKRGRRAVSYQVASKAEEMFGVSHQWLLRGEGEMYVSTKDDRPRVRVELVLLPLLDRISPEIPPTDSLWPLTMHPIPEARFRPQA